MRNDRFEGDEALAELTGPHPMTLLLCVMAAGAVGVGLRYLLDALITSRLGDELPWSTLIVNVIGALAIGVVVTVVATHTGGHLLRPMLTIGLLGGFTTYSALALEAVALGQDGQVGRSVAYVVGTNVLGVLAVIVGMGVGRAILRP